MPKLRACSPSAEGSQPSGEEDVFVPGPSERVGAQERINIIENSKDPFLSEAKIIDWATGVVLANRVRLPRSPLRRPRRPPPTRTPSRSRNLASHDRAYGHRSHHRTPSPSRPMSRFRLCELS